MERLVRGAGPAILRLPTRGEPRFVALLGERRRSVAVLGPDLAVHQLRPEVLRTALCQALEVPLQSEVDRLLEVVGVPLWRRGRVRRTLLGARLSAERIGGGWLVSLPAGGRVWQQLRQARLLQRLLVLLGAHMTHDLVERLTEHRTRLAQEGPAHRHAGEDAVLARYLALARVMDRTAAGLLALVPRGWLLVGLLGFIPAFVTGRSAPPALAVSLGGLLLAFAAFKKLAAGLWHLAGAAIAWEQVAPLFQAAARPQVPTPPALASAPGCSVDTAGEPPVLEAHDLVLRYRSRGEPVLRGISLRLGAGERILLQGPSGGGKSTLATLLTGLRLPESGLLLLGGLDRQTLGAAGWQRRVVAAPQFHDNHVFTGIFAFNLLMGWRWPPQPEDLAQAEALCHALGLTALLNRMPAGLLQLVGETGWQLSHGERSRLFLARAVLQDAACLILDESFAALDPPTLHQALRCVLERAPVLVVIAHP
jgi:ATP-binding cassette subfamily B protein